ncbi:MAG: hypothetical protein KatS3mg113_0177 [Planctomycetaceae bacterium]|nr:MAG: hypothetical protein KatS3mg113_0177 [Planctomycetaceae bacterium]
MRYSRPTVMMCPPEFYGIEYEINPWMHREQPADRELAWQQWEKLRSLLVQLGADVKLQTPQPGWPDLVFTANAGLVWRNTVFLSAFRHAARQGETTFDREFFLQEGFDVRSLPPGLVFEGAGDALFCGDTLYGGYHIRSDARSFFWLAEQLACRVIPLQLVDPRFYHLDTCFCPLDRETAAYYPGAFDDYGRQVLHQIPRRIIVPESEAIRFACNAVVIGRHVILNTGCPEFEASLQQQGFTPHATSLDQFLKSGGSAKCLTLRLDGEEAAGWRS